MRAAGVAVHDAGHFRKFAQDVHRVLPRFSGVNDDGKSRLARQFHLSAENLSLDIPGRKVVVVVKADLSNRHHVPLPKEIPDDARCHFIPGGRFVGMDAYGGVDAGEFPRESRRAHGISLICSALNIACDAVVSKRLNNFVTVFVERFRQKMRVRVENHDLFHREAVFGVGCEKFRLFSASHRQDHPFGKRSAQHGGLQIGDHDDGLSHELLRGDRFPDARDNLPRFVSDPDF